MDYRINYSVSGTLKDSNYFSFIFATSLGKSRTGKSRSLREDTHVFVSDSRNQTKHDALCEQVSLGSQALPCFHWKTKADWHQKKSLQSKTDPPLWLTLWAPHGASWCFLKEPTQFQGSGSFSFCVYKCSLGFPFFFFWRGWNYAQKAWFPVIKLIKEHH